MNIKSKQRSLLAGLLLGAAGIITTHAANSTIVTFSVDMATNLADTTFNPSGGDVVYVHGTFNNWATPIALVQEGTGTVYTNSVNDTDDANGTTMIYQYYFNDVASTTTTYEVNPNRCAKLPATSGASLVLPTPYFNDEGAPVTNEVTFNVDMSEQIFLGNFTNANGSVTVSGSLNGWNTTAFPLTWTPSILVTNQFGLVSSNVWTGSTNVVGSPNGKVEFKYVANGNYESPPNSDSDYDNSNNRYFVNAAQTLPLVYFSDAPFAPSAQVTFSVDMSAQLYYGNWAPGEGVYCQGINGNWNNINVGMPNATQMTNNPNAANTNIYYATFTTGEGSTANYKFTYLNSGNSTVYEQPTSTGGGNRVLVVPGMSPVVVPTVYFGDLSINDLLVSTTMVTFAVDMSNAYQYGTSTPFDPSVDTVWVNGAWLNWQAWSTLALSYQLTNNPVGSSIYTIQVPIPQGDSISMTYKYSIDGSDNEAGQNDNHVRIIRSIPTGAYSFPTDTFGVWEYPEPQFGELSVGKPSGGTVPLSWLGAPNVQVQTASSLTGAWTSLPDTSGVFWSAGVASTNGLVSETNWPTAGGNTYFRLIKQ